MRRFFNFLGVIALSGLVFVLAPSPKALAGSKNSKSKDSSSSCGNSGSDDPSKCNCPPPAAFIAYGNGQAVDDINGVGCYAPSSGDELIPNDDPELTCPTTASGSGVNLACGCILAGGDNFSPADPSSNIALTGDANLGNWSITQLEANFAYGDLDATSASTFFIGNPNGSGAGVNGGRCYGAAGFTTLVSTNGAIYPAPVLYLTLEGTICDTIPLNDPSEPQKFSFTGSYIVDPVRSSAYYSNWSGTGTFVVSMSNVSANPPQYSPSYFSFNGYLLP